jgi:hypothetical protein
MPETTAAQPDGCTLRYSVEMPIVILIFMKTRREKHLPDRDANQPDQEKCN